ncbi:hypothetical protein H4R20_002181 [Coemansia guatemalensis]|uniref:SGNH domain-containing protein n=1 Tax=Coemansia guatemalensis TaxID=2761395 RepID=A0A9W8I4C1_9FUNG|nr:hypothetical protein H4R20_002181 [Coemansia guatemalensis]
MAALIVLTASVLLTGIPPPAQDLIFATTHRDLAPTHGNRTRPVDRIIVLGDAGHEISNQQRAKLCGGNLWIDHLAEALGADLISYAHGYSIRSTQIGKHSASRIERVKSPLSANGQVLPIHSQMLQIIDNAPKSASASMRTLYVVVADPQSATESNKMQSSVLAETANSLILNQRTSARRLLLLDTPMSRSSKNQRGKPYSGLSKDLAAKLINDPAVEVDVYDSQAFLLQMQRQFYKYGLRFPNSACLHSQNRRCTKPDRFFWCDHAQIGSKAHFFLADDIIKRHYMTSLASIGQ